MQITVWYGASTELPTALFFVLKLSLNHAITFYSILLFLKDSLSKLKKKKKNI